MKAAAAATGDRLKAVGQKLENILNKSSPMEEISNAIQACCAEISQYFSVKNQSVSPKAAADVICTLKKALNSIAQRSTTPEETVSAMRAEFWQQSIFPTIESSCVNEQYVHNIRSSFHFCCSLDFTDFISCVFFFCRWHAVAIQADTTPNRSLHAEFQANVRDLLKEGLLPTLATGMAAQNTTTGLCLMPHLQFILHLASAAAELIGWRDPRVSDAPYLRNYGLINALWMGVIKCWAAVPISLQAHLNSAGISAEIVARRLMEYLAKDLEMICRRKECADVKLLQFWAVNISKMMSAYPQQVAPAVWEVLWKWTPQARRQLSITEIQGGKEGAALAHAVRAGSLWIRIARVQAQALSLLGPAAAATAIGKAANELQNLENNGSNGEKEWLMASAVEVLGQAGTLTPAVRAGCMPLFKATLLSIHFADSIATAENCRSLADSFLTYVLSLAAAAEPAMTGQGPLTSNNDASEAPHVQTAWEDCQLCLFECSLIPHPVMMYVLRMLWSSLAAMTNGTTLKHWMTGLNELLVSTAAVEAAGENGPPKMPPTTTQLCHILAAVLGVAPTQLSEGFCGRFLQLDPAAANDRCKLAALAATLRAAALSGRPACCTPALPVVLHLSEVLQRTTGFVNGKTAANRPSPSAIGDSLHVAWLVDCIGAGLECLGAMAGAECAGPADQLETAVASAAMQTLALLKHPEAAMSSFLSSTLRTLHLALQLYPGCLNQSQLENLVPCLESFLSTPAAAAGIACLIPALRVLPQPPKALFEALLGPSQSPTLQFLGKDAYIKYAKECKDENVLGALPRHFLVASTGNLSEAIAPTLEKYLHRTPAAAPGLDPGQPMATTIAAELAKRANMEQGRLVVAANEARAKQEQVIPLIEAGPMIHDAMDLDRPGAIPIFRSNSMGHRPNSDPTLGRGAKSNGLSPVVAELEAAVARMHAAWIPAVLSSEEGAAMVAAVQRARDELSALLAR